MDDNLRHWRTTTCGVITLVATLGLQAWPEYAKEWIFAVGLSQGLAAIFARDRNPTGKIPKNMKRTMILVYIIIGIALMAVNGCSSTNGTQMLKALGADKSTVVHKISTIYGTSYFVRVGGVTNSVTTVSPDGTVSVKIP